MLNYKDYVGNFEFDNEAEIFHGEVINTHDIITFQGKTVEELKKAFVDSIEDYLHFCASLNEAPEKAFSGKFNPKINLETHRQVYIAAKKSGESLNAWVTDAILHTLEHKGGDSDHNKVETSAVESEMYHQSN